MVAVLIKHIKMARPLLNTSKHAYKERRVGDSDPRWRGPHASCQDLRHLSGRNNSQDSFEVQRPQDVRKNLGKNLTNF